jgi:hypothetical protein
LRLALQEALTATLLAAFADWPGMASALRRADLPPVLAALAVSSLGVLLSAAKWRLLLRRVGVALPPLIGRKSPRGDGGRAFHEPRRMPPGYFRTGPVTPYGKSAGRELYSTSAIFIYTLFEEHEALLPNLPVRFLEYEGYHCAVTHHAQL